MKTKQGDPRSISVLIRAEAMQLEAAALGFDWQAIQASANISIGI